MEAGKYCTISSIFHRLLTKFDIIYYTKSKTFDFYAAIKSYLLHKTFIIKYVITQLKDQLSL